MKSYCAIGWALTTLALAPLPAGSEQPAWAEQARVLDLSEAEISALADQGVVVTSHEYRQAFVPYLARMKSQIPAPVFITSDAVLNGYHVLFEESVVRTERRRAQLLEPLLDELWRQLREGMPAPGTSRELDEDAWRCALVTIGTAVELLGGETAGTGAEIDALIDHEVHRVEQARVRAASWWLGVELDYTRYRPRSFYAGEPALERLFRATAWLQAIPFRLDRDADLVAIRILADAYRQLPEGTRTAMAGVDAAFDSLVGPQDDPSIAWVAARLESRGVHRSPSSTSWRRWLSREIEQHGPKPAVNDQLRGSLIAGDSSAEASVRVLPSRRTSDSVLFQKLADGPPPHPPRLELMVSGLHVCAALGAQPCRDFLRSEDPAIALLVQQLATAPAPEVSAFERYLYTVQALLSPPGPRTPAFMRSPAWQAKSVQTVLAGWAQLRHTWQLQTKQATVVLGMSLGAPAGFVEPVPEFYERLTRLVATSRTAFAAAGALDVDAGEIRAMAVLLERLNRERWELTAAEQKLLNRASELAYALDQIGRRGQGTFGVRAGPAERARLLLELAEQVSRIGGLPQGSSLRGAATYVHLDLNPFWDRLEELCESLLRLSRKQIDGERFTDEEDRFLSRFGEQLAFVMLYTGNSYMQQATDDAPRVADVFCNPNLERCLEVGVARPRRIVVLYPYGSSFVLAHGAVLPYLELASPRRLTDTDWRELLDSPNRPATPPWLTAIGPQSEPARLVPEDRRRPNRATAQRSP
jgi:hypothetical protein